MEDSSLICGSDISNINYLQNASVCILNKFEKTINKFVKLYLWFFAAPGKFKILTCRRKQLVQLQSPSGVKMKVNLLKNLVQGK